MYHLQVTVKQFTNHTAISGSLWDLCETGKREQVKLTHIYVPAVAGGLFHSHPDDFLGEVLAEVTKMLDEWRDTGQ